MVENYLKPITSDTELPMSKKKTGFNAIASLLGKAQAFDDAHYYDIILCNIQKAIKWRKHFCVFL